jgi:beta-aspartyl-dipeptidase (metallo-type)
MLVLPGIVDPHVHIAGAGGEGGPATRTPEIRLSELLLAGITTVVGCLGTDGMTRSVESVLMKVKSLRAQGISAWMYTGAYQVPTPTITGEVGTDIALIEEVIGCGEVALSDHRSSHPSTNELIRLAAHSRVGGMLGGKPGIINIHMGDARDPFRPIHEAVRSSELSYKQFYPTHCNRNKYIFHDAKEYGREGWIDLTTSSYSYFPEDEIKPSKAVKELLEAGVPLAHISMSSDANGSLPKFDEEGKLLQLEMGDPGSMLQEVRDLVETGTGITEAVSTITCNPSKIVGLSKKGAVSEGMDADLLITDRQLGLVHLVAMGNLMVENGMLLRKGNYE